LYLVATGEGDEHDNRARARGVTASFSLNGISVTYEEPPDLYRENEELKVTCLNSPLIDHFSVRRSV